MEATKSKEPPREIGTDLSTISAELLFSSRGLGMKLQSRYEHGTIPSEDTSKTNPGTGTMRIPFSHSLSIGTDILRLTRLSESPHAFHKLILRILQPVEQAVFRQRFPLLSLETSSLDRIADRKRREWIGGRWAAKEAAKKAWGASLLSFRDLRVETEADGNVVIVCALLDGGRPSQLLDEQVAKVSISHDGEYAIATVLASPLHESIIAELRRRKSEAEKSVTPQQPGNNEAAIDTQVDLSLSDETLRQ